MAFKTPEKYRATEKILRSASFMGKEFIENMIEDKSVGNNGYFFLPRINAKTGLFYLCKAMEMSEWNCVSILIPAAAGKPANWDELHYIKNHFWDPTDVVAMYLGEEVWMLDRGWLQLWSPRVVGKKLYTPPLKELVHFDPPLIKQFFEKLKRKLSWKKKP